MSFWTHAKAEACEGARITWYWSSRTGLVIGGVYLILAALFAAGRAGTAEERLAGFAAVGGAGLVQAAIAAAAVGLTALARRLAGWGLVAPVILVPVGIFVACWLGADAIHDAARGFSSQLEKASPLNHFIGKIAHVPLLFLFALPFLLVFVLASPGVLFSALILYYLCILVVAAGAIGGGLVSTPVLLVATVKRLRRRARERTGADASKAFDPYVGLDDAQPIGG